MEGIKREKGARQNLKKALMLSTIPELIRRVDNSTITGVRDRAILLLGFALVSSRSELVAINIEDLNLNAFGMVVRIRETKTQNDDQVKGVNKNTKKPLKQIR